MILSRFEGDLPEYQGQRTRLVNQLKKKGIHDNRVIHALISVPRHLFMESALHRFAYVDQAFPIQAGQTISQPYTVAFQSQLLEAKEHQKVLEVGTGSGYQSAILHEMGLRVYTIERIKVLFQSAQTLLYQLGMPIQCFYGDGYQGLPTFGPFDRILITAGAPYLPDALKAQLKEGGILVAPIGPPEHQTMIRCIRQSENQFDTTEHGSFVFVPMLEGKTEEK